MSDGSTGAPAAAPAAAAAPTKAPPTAQAKQPEAPSWTDKDDAETFERLKRAPWAKVKANGEERHISSKDEFLALVADASRGRGANKVVEEAKKTKAEAEAAKREAASIKQAIERARRGDEGALRELGLIRDEAESLTQEQFDALPEPVKAQLRKAHELEQMERKRRTEDEQRQHEEQEKSKELRKQKVLAEAKESAKAILADVREELHDVEIPEIIGAMHALREVGQKLNRDYTPEQLAAYVQQRRQAGLVDRIATLKPDAALKMVLPHLKQMVTSPDGLKTLEAVLGEDFERVAGALSGYRLQKWKAGKAKPVTPAPTQRQESRDESKREPLNPYRRW